MKQLAVLFRAQFSLQCKGEWHDAVRAVCIGSRMGPWCADKSSCDGCGVEAVTFDVVGEHDYEPRGGV